MRYEIDTKQRSGKWSCRCERDTLEAIREEWTWRTTEMPKRAPEGRRRMRLTKVENGKRTVIERYTP